MTRETIDLKGKKIEIRNFQKSDLKRVRDFLSFINSLVDEKAKILINEKQNLKQEQEWLEGKLKNAKKQKEIFLVAQCDGLIVGSTQLSLNIGAESHVGEFGIAIRNGYRGIGLGKHLMKRMLEKARTDFKEKPRVIRIKVFSNNKPAIGLYRKMGFKIVAKIPKQVKYKGKLFSEIILIKELK